MLGSGVSGRPWWHGEMRSFFGASVSDLEAFCWFQPSGRPWRRGEGVCGRSVLSIWRKLGGSCGALVARAYEQLLVHGCEEEVARQAPVGGGDGCSPVFGDLGDLPGIKARLFSASCAPL